MESTEHTNPEMDNEERVYRKKDYKLNMYALALSFISIIVSLFAINRSEKNAQDIANYEFKLSQTPKICVLNQEYQIPILIMDTFKKTIDFENMSNEDFPIKIPIYNIGVGVAQNCKVEINISEQIESALKCKEVFELCNLYPSNYINAYGYSYEYYLSDYVYRYENNNIDGFAHSKLKEKYDLGTDVDHVDNFSFILPITYGDNHNYIEIPYGLSAFILEAVNQSIWYGDYKHFEPITVNITINYQDLDNTKYSFKNQLRFSKVPNSEISEDNPIMRMQLEVEEVE